MYRLFYNKPVTGDILFIVMASEKKPSRVERKGDVAAIYQGDELIGINLFNAQKIFPFPNEGILYAPCKKLIAAVNKAVLEAGISPLPESGDSGFHVAKIVGLEEHPLDEKAQIVSLDLGERKATTVSAYPNLSLGDEVVVALDGTILRDGSVFHALVSHNIPSEVSIMASQDLGLVPSEGAYHPENLKEGSDFFYANN